MKPPCGHKWEPVPNWSGRYKCEWCHIIAYRKFVMGISGSPRLIPYKCKCGKEAVARTKEPKRNWCFDCLAKRKKK